MKRSTLEHFEFRKRSIAYGTVYAARSETTTKNFVKGKDYLCCFVNEKNKIKARVFLADGQGQYDTYPLSDFENLFHLI